MIPEKLSIDIFVSYSTERLDEFKVAVNKAKMIMMREIHLNEKFNPKRYVRYYLTFRILKMPEKRALPEFNLLQQKLERLHNAAISLEVLETKLSNAEINESVYCYFEIGGVYLLESDEEKTNKPWYTLT